MLATILLAGVTAVAVSAADEAAIDAALAARPKDRMEFRSAGGRTEALLNGRPIVPKIYKTSGTPTDKVRALNREIPAEFSRYGFNLFTFSVDLGECADEGASERIRLELREWLRRAPEAHVLLNFYVRPWPGWGEEHPSEVFRTEQGRYVLMTGCRPTELSDAPRTYQGTGKDRNWRFPAVSYCSELFAQAAAEKIRGIVSYLEDKPEGRAVVGVFLGGGCDGQWFDLHDMRLKDERDKQEAKGQAADYSEAARNGFRTYLKAKYGTPEALAAAWGLTNAVPFEKVEVPSTADMWVARTRYREHGLSPQGDYNRYCAWATARFTDTLAQAVKKASNGRLFAGGYYKGAGLGGYPNISLAGTRYRLKDGDGYGFIATVPRYKREWNDPVVTTTYNGSMVRRGRLYVGELDLRNPEIKNWGMWAKDEWTNSHDAGTFRTEVLKFALAAVTAGGGYHAYDMNGGWYRTPAAKETWRVVNAIADHAKALPLTRERIAVVGGEDYFDYQSLGEQPGRMLAYDLKMNLQRTLGFCGVPFSNYLVDEVLDGPGEEMPSLVVFSDLSGVSPAAFAELRQRYARDGRVLVYLWRPCTFRAGAEAVEREFAAFAPVDGLPGASVRKGADVVEYRLDDPKVLDTALLRRLTREAGFEPVVDADEIMGFGSGLFYLQAQTDGVKRIRLPDGVEPGETLYGPSFRREGTGCSVELKRAEMFVMTYRMKAEDDGRQTAQWWRAPALLGRDFWPMMTYDSRDTWLCGKGGCPEKIEMFEDAGLRVYQHSYRPDLANYKTNTSMKSGIVRLSQLLGLNEYIRAASYRGDWVDEMPDIVRRTKPYKVEDFFPSFFASKDLETTRPFMLQLNESRPCQFLRDDGYPLGDRADFEAFRKRHPNFLGFRALSEFDGDFVYYGYHLAEKTNDLSEAACRIRAKFPTRPDGGWRAREWTETCFSNSVNMAFGCSDIWSMTSAICGMQAMAAATVADGGGSGFMYEATPQSWGPWEMAGAFTRGASRQNRLPFGWYVANWYEGCTRDGKRLDGDNKWCDYRGTGNPAAARPHLGASRSLLARQLAYGWLIGASFFCTEGWTWLYVDKRDGRYVPSDECHDAEEIYRLSKRVDRGTSYTPLALLVAVDEPIWLSYYSGGLRDRYAQPAVFATLIPSGARNRWGAPLRREGNQGCLFNSEFGEIFDVLAPDRGYDTATAVERLRPYAYAFLVGDWFDSAKFDRKALEAYVREGGTLVVSVDQLQKGYVSEAMVGVALTGETTPVGRMIRDVQGETPLEGAYQARKAVLKTAKMLAGDETGVPLVWENAVGRGRVLTVACDKCLPQRFASGIRADAQQFEREHADIVSGNGGLGLLKHLFRRIQRQAMPIRVEGDCEWGLNRTKDGWLVWIFNNKGVVKWTLEPEQFDPTKTTSVKVCLGDVRADSATDVRTGETLKVDGDTLSLSVKPGVWRVLRLIDGARHVGKGHVVP